MWNEPLGISHESEAQAKSARHDRIGRSDDDQSDRSAEQAQLLEAKMRPSQDGLGRTSKIIFMCSSLACNGQVNSIERSDFQYAGTKRSVNTEGLVDEMKGYR